MSRDFVAYSLAHHPAPYRHLIRGSKMFWALFGAPIACGIDLMAGYALVGHACYPAMEPLASPLPGFHWTATGVLIVHLVTLALIASAGFVSYSMWRQTGPARGHAHHLMERGEGRDRFFGIVGIAFAMMFFIITAAETLSMGMVPLCRF